MREKFENCCDPAMYVSLMFNNTDKETGMLRFHGLRYDGEKGDEIYDFHMNWKPDDIDKLIGDHKALVDALSTISKVGPDFSEMKEEDFIADEQLLKVWNTYIKDFSGDGECTEEISAIFENFEERSLTQEEEELLDNFWNARFMEAEKRIGKSQFSYNAVNIPRRLCRLMQLGAPKTVISGETIQLMIVMALHRFCDGREEI